MRDAKRMKRQQLYPRENEKAMNKEQASKAINVPKGYSIITTISNLRSFRLSPKLVVGAWKNYFCQIMVRIRLCWITHVWH